MTGPVPRSANDLVMNEVLDRLKGVEAVVKADVLAYSGPISDSTPDLFKTFVEAIRDKRPNISVWLETNGGYVESTERIVNILRRHYRRVDFIVTTYAMSAGTILVMSGDSITMDYSATLGPIDPQISRSGSGRFVPALGYLEQYERLIQKSRDNTLTTAELAYLLQNFDAAELYQFEQARELSVALIEEWLPKYKFKNWRVTRDSKTKVTAAMRRDRANEIARRLNSTSDWHSHSRGISMDVLRRQLKLEIEDISDTPLLAKSIADFIGLMYDFKRKMGHDYFAIACSEAYHGH